MAGAGYKLFNTGDVLTAAQVNTYLQEQVVMRFATTTARDTALSGVLAEGMICYIDADNNLYKYTGSAWVNVDSGSTSPLTTKGDLYTYSTTDARLAVGTNGQFLSADSTTATGLKWATAASGALVKIKSATISSAADTGTTFDDVFTSTYRAYKIECRNITASTGNVLRFQWRKSGPSTHTANYYGMRQQIDSNPIITTTAITAGSYVDTITMSSDPNAASISVANIGNGSQAPCMYGHGFSNNFLSTYWFGNGLNTAITGMGFILSASTGNFSGLVTVYGVEN